MPTLQEAWNRLQGADFVILAVNLGEDAETIQRFLDRFEPELKFPILMASDQSIMEAWKIQALPMSYIIDKEGRLTYIELGPRDFSHEHVISKLLELMDTSVDD
jgi:peroxiredoxin